MTADIPNAFIQAELPNLGPDDERVIMKITGVLVELLVNMSPEVYGPYINGQTQESNLCTSPESPIWHVNLSRHMVYKTTQGS